MNILRLAIVHRLPQSYRWLAGFAGTKVEPIPQDIRDGDNTLIGLKLLSADGENAWTELQNLSQALSEIAVESVVLEYDGEPCLFVKRQDESAATGRLKNFGVAIAENFSGNNPF